MSEKIFLFIRDSGRNVKLDLQRILYIEARKNYSYLVTTEKNFMLLTPLKDWALFLPQDSFCRIHRA
jgi:DNA-binding LytR/AlgR family response regulator